MLLIFMYGYTLSNWIIGGHFFTTNCVWIFAMQILLSFASYTGDVESINFYKNH